MYVVSITLIPMDLLRKENDRAIEHKGICEDPKLTLIDKVQKYIKRQYTRVYSRKTKLV